MNAPVVSIFPALAFGAIGGVLLLLALFISVRGAALVLGVMLFLSGISVIIDYDKYVYRTWLLPLQMYRSELYGAFGIVLMLGMLPRVRLLRLSAVSWHAWMLLVIGLFAGVMRAYHSGIPDGAISLGLLVGAVFPIALVVPCLFDSERDATRLLRIVIWSMCLWVGGVVVQFVVNRKLLVLGTGYRFTGLIANCNQAATMLAVASVTGIWLSLNDRIARRPLYLVVSSVFLVLLLWTGSRGGMGMFVLGLAIVLYSRVGKSVMFLPLFALLLFVALKITAAAQIELGAERLLSTDNTRASSWTALLRDALTSPLVGIGPDEVEGSESSYLLGFASYGIGMLLMLLALVGIGAVHTFRLYRIRRRSAPEVVALIDFCIAQQVMFYAGSVFEGYITGRVGYHITTILIFAAMGTYIIRRYGGVPAEIWQEEPDTDGENEAVTELQAEPA
jgi:hypothetical protein